MKMLGCHFKKGKLIIKAPDFVSALAAIKAPSPLAWIGIDPPTI
jgi:hypothetical protein